MDQIKDFSTNSQTNLQLGDVLLSPLLATSIQEENLAVLNFFKQDSVIRQLAEWSFTTKYKDDPQYAKLSEKSVFVLLSCSLSLSNILLDNKNFAEVLHEFLISDDSKIPRLCGYFSRVLSELSRWGVPSLFTNYSDIESLLLNRIENLAIRDLITLAVLSNARMVDTEKIIETLSQFADENSDENSLYLLASIFKSALNDSNLCAIFNSRTVINHLINAAAKTESAVLKNDIFKCLSKSEFSIEMIEDSSVIKKITISEDNINDLSIASIDVMNLPINDLFPLFFSKNSTEKLHEKLISKVELTTVKQLVEVANVPDFIVNIINSYGTDKWCPHCIQFILYFLHLENRCKPLKSKKWKMFAHGTFQPIFKILSNEYGGKAPREFSEEASSDENENVADSENEKIDFEEEEDFYDHNFLDFEEDSSNVAQNIELSDNDEGELEINV